MTDKYGLTVGRRYKVRLDDCCVRGEFTAVLTEITGDDDWTDKLIFDNGVVLEEANGVAFEDPE